MNLHAIIVWAILLTHGILLGGIAAIQAPMFDEIAHLPAGLAHWRYGNFDLYRVNPPLMRMIAAIPLLVIDPKTDWTIAADGPFARPEFSVGSRFMQVNGYDSFWYFTICRWILIPVSILGGWICYRWAADLFGNSSGVVALTLWCSCPNVLTWGSTITPDLGAATFGVAACYTFWRWLKSPAWTSALVAGGVLGLAELSKTTWVILFGLWPIMWCGWRFCVRLPTVAQPPLWQLVGIMTFGLYLLNLGYGFENSFQRLDQFAFISRTLGGNEAHETPNNRFRSTWLGAVPVPLPANYLKGIDVQKYDFEARKWSYLRGEARLGGWYHYYIYALALKTPLGTLLILACAGFLASRQCKHSTFVRDNLVLLIPAIAVLLLVSSQTGFNRYLRYVLPAVPFLYIFASQVGRAFDSAQSLPRILVGACLGAATLGSLSVYPHSMSYFNFAAGGPHGGPAHLLDANIDWGQDLLELKRFVDCHPEVRPIGLAYFGYADPKLAGFDYVPISQPRSDDGQQTFDDLSPGWYAVSINHLHGYRHYDFDKPIYTRFQRFTPKYMVGYSICVFQITSADLAEVRK